MVSQEELIRIIKTINRIAVNNYGDQISLYLDQLSSKRLDTNDINYVMTRLHREYKVNCVKVGDTLVIEKIKMTNEDNSNISEYIDQRMVILILKNIYTQLRGNKQNTRNFFWSDLYSEGEIPFYTKDFIIKMLNNYGIQCDPLDTHNNSILYLQGLDKIKIDLNAEIPFPDVNQNSNYIFTNPKT